MLMTAIALFSTAMQTPDRQCFTSTSIFLQDGLWTGLQDRFLHADELLQSQKHSGQLRQSLNNWNLTVVVCNAILGTIE